MLAAAAVSWSAARSPPAASRPVITTCAPAFANPAAIPLPIPLVPPVTSTDRPLIESSISDSLTRCGQDVDC